MEKMIIVKRLIDAEYAYKFVYERIYHVPITLYDENTDSFIEKSMLTLVKQDFELLDFEDVLIVDMDRS